MNKVSVKIQGSEYQMTGEKPIETMKKIAEYVDSEMSTIAEANSRLSVSAISILTALNIADILFECSEENEELLKELDELKANYNTEIENKSSEEVDELKNSVEEKDKEIESLTNSLEQKNSELEELESKMQELMDILETKKKEILELKNNSVSEEDIIDEKVKELEQKLEEANEKTKIAEQIASEFQNNAYELQLENTELKNKISK